jgi:hypothetical protein
LDIQQITAWVQFATEVLIAVGVGYNTLQAMLAKRDRKALSGQVAGVAAKVDEVHTATNGMQGAIVAATEKEALARGVAIGVAASAEKKAG